MDPMRNKALTVMFTPFVAAGDNDDKAGIPVLSRQMI
jgi:hypothetical protein